MGKSLLMRSLTLGIILGVSLYSIAKPHIISADFEKSAIESYQVAKKIKMIITAYSSSPDETTGIPDKPGIITASGKYVADGIVANNSLSFGTKIRIPKLYGNKIFTVEDRLHPRKGKYHIDIWMTSKQKAKNFGATITEVEILES